MSKTLDKAKELRFESTLAGKVQEETGIPLQVFYKIGNLNPYQVIVNVVDTYAFHESKDLTPFLLGIKAGAKAKGA